MTTSPTFRFKARNYLHFDLPVSRVSAERLACNPLAVARHSFYPFLGFTTIVKKVARDENRAIVKKRKPRQIKIAAHRDAAIYSRYSDLLAPAYERKLAERGLSEVVTAFRSLPSGGTNIDFAGHVFRYINNNRPCIVLAFDLKEFFDTLDHKILKTRWCYLLGVDRLPADHFAVFRSLTSFSWVDRNEAFKKLGISIHNPKADGRNRVCHPGLFRAEIREAGLLQSNPYEGKGIPQGSPISALLSNIYMLDFDQAVNEGIAALGGFYRRYCDDIIVVIPPSQQAAAEQRVLDAVSTSLVTCNEEKTDRVEYPSGEGTPAIIAVNRPGFSGHIQYLGFTYDGVRTLIRPGSLARYYGKMRAGVSLAKQTQRSYNRREKKQGLAESPLKTRKLYLQYSYLIARRTRFSGNDPKANGNFLSYAYRASKKLSAPEIKLQIRNHWSKLQSEIRG
ncbi:MAG: hypothetical protein EOP06_04730 [Proteobacteria bacterium]|nr:MAG: hypothetical protein EOP06_04730 [Pseudomonadota bacterium]